MSWYNEAVFYHIYPLGMLNCEKTNDYAVINHRLNNLLPFINVLKETGFNAIYIGPLFKSEGHGYETVDYKCVDNRLGDNKDLKEFVSRCHQNNIRVILDGVFNHVGRDFFAFKDLKENRENSYYKDWFCNVNFYSNNSYNDGFSYENWGGYDLLVKLNQRNNEVSDYICDAVKFWIEEFNIDGIRLDAADVLDFDFMKKLRWTTDNLKEDFWLMGEVIHGDYSRWVNDNTLHSVTNYQLHKALFSGMNDHNFFEIAHTVKRLNQIGNLDLYNFVDNHDVERIITKLNNKNHYLPVHIMLYTLPGVPSVYYGSEMGIEGHKYRGGSDDEIRPYIDLNEYENNYHDNCYNQIITILNHLRSSNPILSYGTYNEIELQTTYYSYTRELNNHKVLIAITNTDNNHEFYFHDDKTYYGLFTNKEYYPENGVIKVLIEGNSGDILIEKDQPFERKEINIPAVKKTNKETIICFDMKTNKTAKPKTEIKADHKTADKPYEEMSIEELQEAILAKMAKNGPLNEQMIKSVRENIYHNSLISWVKSFH